MHNLTEKFYYFCEVLGATKMVTTKFQGATDQHTKNYKDFVKKLPTTNFGTTAYTNLVGYLLERSKLDSYENNTYTKNGVFDQM